MNKGKLFIGVLAIGMICLAAYALVEDSKYTSADMTYRYSDVVSDNYNHLKIEFEKPQAKKDVNALGVDSFKVEYYGCEISSPNGSTYEKAVDQYPDYQMVDWSRQGERVIVFLRNNGPDSYRGFEIHSGEACHTKLLVYLTVDFAQGGSEKLILRTFGGTLGYEEMIGDQGLGRAYE